jgi:hypothetical protein
VTLVLLSNDPGLGEIGFGTGGMGRVWHLWAGAASLCEASTELKSLSRAQSRELLAANLKLGVSGRRLKLRTKIPLCDGHCWL